MIETLFISWCDSCAWLSGMECSLSFMLLSPLLKYTTQCLTVPALHKCSVNVDECQSVPFLPQRRIQFHAFIHISMSDAVCQTAPLLPSVTQQQKTMEYWCEGSALTVISPVPTYDVVGQHNKIGGITFRVSPIHRHEAFYPAAQGTLE